MKSPALLALLILASSIASAWAQVPNFFDPQRRIEKPDLGALKTLRFLTEDDYPPFNFTSADGTLTGFNVDLARAICAELAVTCTIQPRRWDTIATALDKNEADASIASTAITTQSRRRVDFTMPYYRTPARFIARSNGLDPDLQPETLAGRVVGVQSRTAHEAYLRAFFPGARLALYDNAAALRSALKRGEIDLAFGDGVSWAVWLSSAESDGCCRLRGGPYTESRYFGDGVGIAVRRGNGVLRRGLDYALTRLADRGVYADLYLKYFPIGFY